MPNATNQPYDPTNPTPYTPAPIELPEVGQPKPQQDWGQAPQPGPLSPKGALGKIGGLANVADNILRGYMKGKQQADLVKAQRVSQMAQGLRSAYQITAQKYADQVFAGGDPNELMRERAQIQKDLQASQAGGAPTGQEGVVGVPPTEDTSKKTERLKEIDTTLKGYAETRNAVQHSFDAMTTFYANQMEAQGKGGKGKKKKSDSAGATGQNGQPDTLSMIRSDDPNERAQGILQFYKKSGPPIFHQIDAMQAQVKRQAEAHQRDQQQQFADVDARIRQAGIDPNSEEGKKERARMLGVTGKLTRGLAYLSDKDNKMHTPWYTPEGALDHEEISEDQKKTSGKATRAWAKDAKGKIYSVELDDKNQVKPGTENYDLVPPPTLTGSISTHFFHTVDANGDVHQIEETTSRLPASGGGGGEGGGHTPTADAPSKASATTAAGGTSHTSPAHDSTKGGPLPVLPKQSPASNDKVIAFKGNATYNAAQKDAENSRKLYASARERMKNPNGVGDKAILFSWVRSQVAGAGRMTNVEIEQALQSQSFDQKINTMWQKFKTGGMDATFRRQLVYDIGIKAKSDDDALRELEKKSKYLNKSSEGDNSAPGKMDDIDEQILQRFQGK